MIRAMLNFDRSAGVPARPPSPVIRLEEATAPSETQMMAAASVNRRLMGAPSSLIAEAPIVFGHGLAITRRVGIRGGGTRRLRFALLGGGRERLQLDLIDELEHHIR